MLEQGGRRCGIATPFSPQAMDMDYPAYPALGQFPLGDRNVDFVFDVLAIGYRKT